MGFSTHSFLNHPINIIYIYLTKSFLHKYAKKYDNKKEIKQNEKDGVDEAGDVSKSIENKTPNIFEEVNTTIQIFQNVN